MTQQLVERYSKEHNITYEEAVKQIQFLIAYMPKKGKDTVAPASW